MDFMQIPEDCEICTRPLKMSTYTLLFSGIQKYASEPPKALTAALGREVEKYDQLCDAVEAQLVSRGLATKT